MSRLGRAWRDAISCAAPLAVLLAAHLKILTYVTAQDPFTYVRTALELVDGGFGPEAWRSVAGFIAPGFPLLLAGIVLAAGPLAVAWLGVAFMGAAFGLLHALFRRWGLSPWGAMAAGLAALLLIWRGDPLNAHFLLYAFRGAPQFFFCVAAVYAAERASSARRGAFALLPLATLLLFAGASIRETTVLAGPGLALWIALDPAWRGRRLQALFWLALPALLALGAAAALVFGGGLAGHNQAQTWFSYLKNEDFAVYAGRLATYGRIFRHGPGLPMMGLLGLSAWFFRRRPGRLALWLLPAFLLAAFYSAFLVHNRYWLDSQILLAVPAGFAAGALADALGRRCPGRARAAVPVLAALALLAGNARTIAGMGPWSAQVGRADVRRLVRALRPWRDGPILADPKCPVMLEALMVYARVQPLEWWERLPHGAPDSGLLYVHPETRGHWKNYDVVGRDAALRWADVEPLLDACGQPVALRLGDLSYTLHRIRPWSARRSAAELPGDVPADGMLWLDFRESDPNAARTVRLLDAAGGLVREWTVGTGNGLVPFHVGDAAGAARVEVESSSPLPAELLARPAPHRGGPFFVAESGRRPSIVQWLRWPTHVAPLEKWAGTFDRRAGFSFPAPRGAAGGGCAMATWLEPRHRRDQTAVFRYSVGDAEAAVFTNRADRGRFVNEVVVPVPDGAERLEVRLEVEVPENWNNHFRVVGLGGYVKPSD